MVGFFAFLFCCAIVLVVAAWASDVNNQAKVIVVAPVVLFGVLTVLAVRDDKPQVGDKPQA